MRYSISNAIPHNPKSEKHPYENLVNTAFIVFTSLHINSPFHSQNVEKEPYAMSIS